MLRLIVTVLAFEHLRRGPVFAFHVALQVDLTFEHLLAQRTHLHRLTVGVDDGRVAGEGAVGSAEGRGTSL